MPRAAPLLLLAAVLHADPAPPTLRLDGSVRPLGYAAELTLAPGEPRFSAAIRIDVELRESRRVVWLNALGLEISSARAEQKGATRTAHLAPGAPGFLGLEFDPPLAAGHASLRFEYTGPVSARTSAGIFLGHDAGNDYIFTQFESTDARRAFPCFDQPEFKTPWRLTLHVPLADLAFANAPQVSETPGEGGRKKVVFAASKPLASYLVAFAVGPFDVVDAGRAGRNHTPLRIIVPKGKAAQAAYAASVVGTLLERLEAFFDMPYPFEKLDSVALTQIYGFGAMENAGLITYAQNLIAADPAVDTEQRRRRFASVALHEMSHQWFGDLVTLAWWNDTWLNEAFATWTSSAVLAAWQPGWNTRLGDLGGKFGAMADDSLEAARSIHQPIRSIDDISNAFDGITYQKGAAVIHMFESWAGHDEFLRGVHAYLHRYAYGNSTAAGFLDAVSAASRPDLARAFRTFLDQPGLPVVGAELRCSGAGASVALAQSRYHPLGSAASAESWRIPVCLRYESNGKPAEECFLLDGPRREFRLTHAAGCPTALTLNADAAGYYLASYGSGLPDPMHAAASIPNPLELRTFANDLAALSRSGAVPPDSALDRVPALAANPVWQIAAQAQAVVLGVKPLVDPALDAGYARFVREAFGPRAHSLAWSPRPGEDSDAPLARAALVPFAASEGHDRDLIDEARKLASGWLDTRRGVDASMLASVLATAARFGDAALFDRMVAALRSTQDRQLRARLITALGAFEDPALARRALALLLDPDLDLRETGNILFAPLANPGVAHLPFEFVKANYPALIGRAPRGGGSEFGARLARTGEPFCDASSLAAYQAFFGPRASAFIGGPRIYAATVERIHLCDARRQAQAEAINAFFRSR